MTTGMILGSKTTKNGSFFCDRTRSDQDENWDENGDDDWDDAGMMHSGLVGFLWQQLIKGKVYFLALAQWSCELSCD